jgi:mono/diheme cytochrome c family protein
MLKKVLLGVGAVLLLVALALFAFVYVQVSAFDASTAKVYPIAPPAIVASNDPLLIARGKHLTESIGGCVGCHGADLGGKRGDPMGPLGVAYPPNLTSGKGGVGSRYTDGQLARVIRDGIKADGRSVRFMPAQDLSWWPDTDLVALVSYLRSLPPIDRASPASSVGLAGKLLDRLGKLPIDIARHIDHVAPRAKALTATATRAYGKYLARSCASCHGPGLSGGRIPGAPAKLAVPANITPHETGIKRYTEADFMRLLDTGKKPNGTPLDPFMPIAALRAMNDTERRALFAYLMSLPPTPFGRR